MKNNLIHLSGDATKNGRSRKVPISPFLMNTLIKIKRINKRVFTYKGRHITDIRSAFVKGCAQAGI